MVGADESTELCGALHGSRSILQAFFSIIHLGSQSIFGYLQSLLSQIKNLSTELVHFVRSEH